MCACWVISLSSADNGRSLLELGSGAKQNLGSAYGVLSPRCIIQQKVFKTVQGLLSEIVRRSMLEWTLGKTVMLRVEPIFSKIICYFLEAFSLCCWQLNTKYFVFPLPQSYTVWGFRFVGIHNHKYGFNSYIFIGLCLLSIRHFKYNQIPGLG